MKIEASFETLDKLSMLANQLLGKKYVQTIFEFGSRYGEDSIEFSKRYPKALIYSFECNPNTLAECKKNLEPYRNILLTEKAVSNIDGLISFYKIDASKTQTTWPDGNQGASSLLRTSGKYPIEKYVQEEITVESIRLSSFINQQQINQIDILWMDIQGAELLALQGLDDDIHKVKIIHLEVEFFDIYQGQPLFNDVNLYLTKYNFKLLGFSSNGEFAGDAIFINMLFFSERDLKKSGKLLSKPHSSIFHKMITTGRGMINVSNMLERLFCLILKKVAHIALKALHRTTDIDSSFKISLPKDSSSREILLWRLKVINPLLKIDIQFRKNISHRSPIDIVIPVSNKDVKHLKTVINNALTYIKHPINKIFVISAVDKQVIKICKETGAIFIDETSVQPLEKHSIQYSFCDGNRAGWLFQQLLKLNADTFVQTEDYLLLDADTVFLRPKVFKHKEKTIFDLSEERHEPYHHVYEKIFKRKTTSELSFISHHMLINKRVMEQLKEEIEIIHQKKWYEVVLQNVDYTNRSGFSEYEMYGNYFLDRHIGELKKEYWFNTTFHSQSQSNYMKTLSFHSYLSQETSNGHH